MITSVHNPKIQAVRKLLAQAKARRESGTFVIEGVRLVEEALRSGWEVRQLFYTSQLDERGKALVDEFAGRGAPIELVSGEVMDAVSETDTPQGILAVLVQRTLALPQPLDFVLVLDGLRDPGNLGTVLRTAAAAGVQAVLLTPGSTDAWSPKVLRAGMGAHFRLPIRSMSWLEIRQMLKGSSHPLQVYLADSAAGVAYHRADFQPPLALIIGGEAAGAGNDSRSMADERVHIPMPGGSESLNAGIAASILLFEVVRQRSG